MKLILSKMNFYEFMYLYFYRKTSKKKTTYFYVKKRKEKKKEREVEISIFKLSIKRNKYNLIPFPVFLHVTIIKADNITN